MLKQWAIPVSHCSYRFRLLTFARQCSTVVVRSYVMQDDILLGILTVRETFKVAAQLRLPSSVTAEQKAAIVDAIINVSSGPCLQLQCHRTAIRSISR